MELLIGSVGIGCLYTGLVKTVKMNQPQNDVFSEDDNEELIVVDQDGRRRRNSQPFLCSACLTRTQRTCRSCSRVYCGCEGNYCSDCRGEINLYDEEVEVLW